MTKDSQAFDRWLREAQLPAGQLSVAQLELLRGSFEFLEQMGRDHYSLRLLSHFLLHCGQFSIAAVGRLVSVSRTSASKQHKLSSKEVVQAAHHRMRGSPYGKLLPRYAGPIAQFLLQQPQATRYDLIDFIEQTWDVHVSRVALARFLNQYGLDATTMAGESSAAVTSPALPLEANLPVPRPTPDFFFRPPNTPEPSFSCPLPCSG